MSTVPRLRLLESFERTFRGSVSPSGLDQGDLVAIHLYEDLLGLGKSTKLKERIEAKEWVVNIQNTRRGIAARRGDGTFGEKVPGSQAVDEAGFDVARGPLATVEIGIEVKILAKSMIKQIDRVGSDLRGQVEHFRRGGGSPISVGIVGINHAERYTSYEGAREYPTDGKREKHPFQEAPMRNNAWSTTPTRPSTSSFSSTSRRRMSIRTPSSSSIPGRPRPTTRRC